MPSKASTALSMVTHLLFPAQTLGLGQLEETVIDRVNQGHHGHVVHLWGEQKQQESRIGDSWERSSLGLGTQAFTAAQVTSLASPSGSQRCCR